MRILVKRSGALGDVVLTTPVVRELRHRHPDAHITVLTRHPAVYQDNPHVNAINSSDPESAYDLHIDLDSAYEKDPTTHIVLAYMRAAFGDTFRIPAEMAERVFQQELFSSLPQFKRTVDKRVVLVHGAGATWRNRMHSAAFWIKVHALLKAEKFKTVSIGGPADHGGGSVDLRGQLSLHGLWRMVKQSGVYLGSDSGPLHVAGATDRPVIGLFTCALPHNRLPMRPEPSLQVGLMPALDCVGCLHKAPTPVTTIGCARDDYACVGDSAVEPELVLTWVKKFSAEGDRQTAQAVCPSATSEDDAGSPPA